MASARKQPLGRLLIEAGLISESDLELVLARQQRASRRLGDLLVEGGYVTSARLTQLLSHQLSLPWVSPDRIYLDEVVLALVPRELALRHCLVPIYVRRSSSGQRVLYVATDNPLDEVALRECEQVAGMRVRPLVAAADGIRRAICRHYDHEPLSDPPMPADSEAPDARGAMGTAASARIVSAQLEPDDPESRISARPTVPGPLADEIPYRSSYGAAWTAADHGEALAAAQHSAASQPSILVAHAPRRLIELCRQIAPKLPASVSHAELAQLVQRARELHPIAIVVTEDVYAFDRVAFNRLSLEVSAPLVLWSDELEEEYLEPLLVTAFESAKGRI